MGTIESSFKEPTPRDRNNEFKVMYGQIPPFAAKLEIKKSVLQQMIDLIEQSKQEPRGSSGAQREIHFSNIWEPDSVIARQQERERRSKSEILILMRTKITAFLEQHSKLTRPGIRAVALQFTDDYIRGRRPGQESHSDEDREIEFRFASEVLLDWDDPESSGVFDPNAEKVREIERTMIGSYKDWCEFGADSGIPQMVEESKLVEEWEQAFYDKYQQWPFPNLRNMTSN